jgi:transposase, IS5 family
MRPKREPEQPQRELLQMDLEQLIYMSHPSVRLGLSIDWQWFEQTLGSTFHPRQGAPGTSTRPMVAPHYLKYQQDLSDEDVVAVWVEILYSQHFSGMRYFQHWMPIEPSSMTRWRKRLRGFDALGSPARRGIACNCFLPYPHRVLTIEKCLA